MNTELVNENFEKKDYHIIVKISSDYYNAFITIDASDYSMELTKEELIAALKTKKVVFGIDDSALQSIIDDPENAEKILVASGIKHEHGKNSIITNKFSDASLKPKIKADGTVDFKNTNFVHSIKQSEIIATKSAITLGVNGTTVTGMTIRARDGKLANFKFGKNVELADEGMSIIASIDGSLKFEGLKVLVIEVLVINGDVGIKTGNISFSGKIIINGTITSGFTVETQDSIEINGVVESSEILAGDDIIINGGVQGNDDCLIKAGGDIKGTYFNNCRLVAGGNINADSIMHSDVMCDETITVRGKKGLITGGTYVARHHIVASVIGSEIGTITKLQLGITNEIMVTFQELASKVKEYKLNISKLKKAFDILKKQKSIRPNDAKIAELYESTQMSIMDYSEKLKIVMTDFVKVNDLIEKLRDVYAKGEMIHPGVRIKIGNSHYNVKTDLVMVKITKDHGEIVLRSF